jgi:hypothetical protein
MKDLKWLSINDVLRSIPAMDRQAVSKVARGLERSTQTKEGWVQAYIATNGNPKEMAKRLTGRNNHETWKDRRKQFLARHLKKVKLDNEPLWKNGQPTRRHLSLVAWGYSPNISRLQKWLKTQPTLESEEWKKGVKIPKRNPSIGYNSWAWTTQDWRSIFIHSNGSVSYDKKCGAIGTKLPSGKPRLCLPVWVIEQLLKTASGKQILVQQAKKKQRAKKGQRIEWHPKIKKLHRQLENRTPTDDPRMRRKKNPYMPAQFFIDRNIPAREYGLVLAVDIDENSLALLQGYSDQCNLDVEIDDLGNVFLISTNWQYTLDQLQQLFI